MLVRITIMVMRLCVLAAGILGILFWTGRIVAEDPLLELHMGLGILVALSLLVMGYFIATVKGGNSGLAIGAFVLAICMTALGWSQLSVLHTSSLSWLIQIVHPLLGLLAIGVGEMIARHYKRLSVSTEQSQKYYQ